MEKEISECWIDRYCGEGSISADEAIGELRQQMFAYLERRQLNVEVPTYFQYWEDEDTRQQLWLLERDPIAGAMMMKVSKTLEDAIDGRSARLKSIGDGSHAPIKEIE